MMVFTIKHSRIVWLAGVVLAAICMVLSLQPSTVVAQRNSGITTANSEVVKTKTWKSEYCGKRVNLWKESWACATVRGPSRAVSGETISVKYTFRVRKDLKNVTVCFESIERPSACSYKRKYRRLARGKTITRTLKMTVPTLDERIGRPIDNRTKMGGAIRWPTRAWIILYPAPPV